ncbi:MAG TPA: gluconate 2-dehydrogenase subunit 3 family protein [Acidimicrobiales bacterium]|nr:gluconate 2-dehydrogenase subunit 3 family protein [Acidimicrobiales bacterium]
MSSAATPGGSDHFPGFDVVARSGSWDPVTTGVVLARLGPLPPLRFFSPGEEAAARPLVDRLLAQDGEPKIPVFELIDARLAEGQTDGWRYDDLPEDGAAWKRSLHCLDVDAAAMGPTASFASLDRASQIRVLEAVRTGDHWHQMPASRVWSLWMRYACTAFYSHPWAWNEIGFGGPAYPTGYKNLGVDGREGWEVAERDAFDPEPWARRVERARARHRGEPDRP